MGEAGTSEYNLVDKCLNRLSVLLVILKVITHSAKKSH